MYLYGRCMWVCVCVICLLGSMLPWEVETKEEHQLFCFITVLFPWDRVFYWAGTRLTASNPSWSSSDLCNSIMTDMQVASFLFVIFFNVVSGYSETFCLGSKYSCSLSHTQPYTSFSKEMEACTQVLTHSEHTLYWALHLVTRSYKDLFHYF